MQGLKQAGLLLGVAALAAGAGIWWARRDVVTPAPAMQAAPGDTNPGRAEKKPLYWYDPMAPEQHFDQPGKSPFMDMQLVPKYADDTEGTAALKVDPAVTQNLGMRLATVTRGTATAEIEASGVLAFNERDVAVVQARSGGFVERVLAHAPGDVIAAGAPLAVVLIPEWAAAQQEFIALLATNDASLIDAARARLTLTGMPEAQIRRVEQTRQVQASTTIAAPIAGVIQALDVRAGMTLAAGQTLARINGLGTVWLDVAVPEAQAGSVRVGQGVAAALPAYPGETFSGKVSAILPEASLDTRSLRVRVELPNRDGRLKPGLSAQVRIVGAARQDALRIPSEALIRTGKRTLVMLAEAGGRYRPVEVHTGIETGEFTVILDGLEEGQKVVASGQFLLDSEASLRGLTGGKQP
jgi:Cu(I)/Ag(I) efflux system membrane fusion protein